MAQDGWYEFDRCVPVDTVALADVQAGEILTREWSFAVNAEPRIASRVVSGDGTMDPRNILTGVDGMLYNEDGDEMATINQWRMEVNFTNAFYYYLKLHGFKTFRIGYFLKTSVILLEVMLCR